MTREEWLAATNPLPMLMFLAQQSRTDDLRRFAVACYQCVEHLLDAEGRREREELGVAASDSLTAPEWQAPPARAAEQASTWAALAEATDAAAPATSFARAAVHWALLWGPSPPDNDPIAVLAANQPSLERFTSAKAQQADLLRCVAGPPGETLRPCTFPPHVLGLAQECRDAFPAVSDRYLILADALADLGEDAAAAHCRAGKHFRGCRVLDWVLGVPYRPKGGDTSSN